MEIDNSWYIFKGDGREPHNKIKDFNKKVPPPPWRGEKIVYIPTEKEIAVVNASIYLRRPLLLTGRPGTGKSSLAYAVGRELNLEVLHWAVNSKTILEDGLYEYDAISRLHDAQRGDEKSIEEYITLNPLGKAFLKGEKCVLLIDEFDKSDVDLANDLLHILEENEFEIPVLKRYKKVSKVNLGNKENPIIIKDGKCKISSENLPIIIITSNQERDFPPGFMRRCLYHYIEFPFVDRLVEIACKHLNIVHDIKDKRQKEIEILVEEFMDKRNAQGEYKERSELAIDQLLNAAYLRLNGKVDISNSETLKNAVFHNLER